MNEEDVKIIREYAEKERQRAIEWFHDKEMCRYFMESSNRLNRIADFLEKMSGPPLDNPS